MTAREEDVAARLLERLLSDPAYRSAFRADPVTASREAGLESVAEEMAAGQGKVMQTLDGRESRSSLAGVLMAAAFEGAAIVDFSQQVLPHLDDPHALGDLIARVLMPGAEDAQAATPRAAAVAPIAGEFQAVTPDQATAARAGSGIDPSQLGQNARGSPPVPGIDELLHSKHVSLDADGIADLKAGRVDPRVIDVLIDVSKDHTISVSAMLSDHDKFTSGGSVSNHFYGRAADISMVDGQAVSPGNAAARELAVALSKLPASIRPTEIGSPWVLPGAAYFTDGAHQNHIHVAFDDPLPGGWNPPDELAATPDADAAPAAGAMPAVELDDSSEPDEPPEPGGLEDPGGDTDVEADAESDGDGGDNDSISDDESDEEEDDEGSDESDGEDGGDGGVDGDHDDSSDQGSDDTDDSDGSDGGEDDGDAGSLDGDVAADPVSQPIDLEGFGEYPGNDASQAELAAWMGAAAQKRGLPSELPVMAALVESGVKNLNHGDADSVGFFQMRLSVWNKGDYASYPDNPALQLKWFLDQAAAVKEQRVAAGKSVTDPNSYGDWIADIERPAVQYRGRYQVQLDEARGLLRRSTGSGDGHGGAAQLEPVVDGGGGGTAGPRALAAVHEARRYLGTPYQWGGSTPQTGFDCSGLMQWAYAKAGIRIPRTTYLQIDAANARAVGRDQLEPGDLIFFRNSSGDVHHVGMSLGGDRFIQAPHTGDVVKISSLKEPYYAQEFAGGRRFDLSGGRGARAAAAALGGADGEAATPSVDPAAARAAEQALLRDAAEVQRPGTLLFEAVRAQELSKLREQELSKP